MIRIALLSVFMLLVGREYAVEGVTVYGLVISGLAGLVAWNIWLSMERQ